MSTSDRCHAVLHFMEAVVRDQLPDADDPTSDYNTLHDCVKTFGADLAVLRKQASALWRKEFDRTLDSAHSMRCVEIELDEKDPKRQELFRCDACGRQEKWCGMAIDLAGGKNKPNEWFREPSDVPSLWDEFIGDYSSEFEDHPAPCHRARELRACDLGRFYVGKTCLRKAKLHFIISTFIPELLYTVWTQTRDMDEVELAAPELYTVDEDSALELGERKEQLELCVAQEKRQDMPDVMVDRSFWALIDGDRSGCPESAIKERARKTLRAASADPAADTEEEEEEKEDDDEWEHSHMSEGTGDEDEEPGPIGRRHHSAGRDQDALDAEVDEEDGLSMRQRSKQPVRKQAHKRGRVIDSDAEDEEGAPAAATAVAVPPKKRPAGQAPSRRSGRVRGVEAGAPVPADPAPAVAMPPTRRSALAPAPAVTAPATEEEEDDEDIRVCDLADTSRARPAVRTAPASAVRTATAMRIPPGEGQPAALPARRAVLLSVMDLARKLTHEGRDGDASTLDAAVVTLRELIEIAQRARGTRSNA